MLYQGLAAMDCPLCGQAVGFLRGTFGPAPAGVPVVKRSADKAAEWAVSQAVVAGGTLQGYTSWPGAGSQYANYWSLQEIQRADAAQRTKNQGP